MSSTPRLDTWYAHAGRTGRGWRLVGALAVLVLALGLAIGPVTATAQEEEKQPEPTELKFEKQAYWTNSSGEVAPNILVESFPPQLVCLVFPDVCGPETEPVVDEVRTLKKENDIDEDNAPVLPAQPFVPEGTLPTGRAGGQPHYASAIKFELPPTPEGMEIDTFILRVHQAQPTYASDSPLFRQLVLAVLRGIQDEDPQATLDEIMVALNNPDEYPPADTAPMRIEGCPPLTDWKAGDNQSWDKRPPVGFCLGGNEGERKELEDGSVVYDFDVSTAMRQIDEGEAPNLGIKMHPFAADNTAYGDRDPTNFAQLSLGGPDGDAPPVALITYREQSGTDTFTLDSGTGGLSTGGSEFQTDDGAASSDTSSTSEGGGAFSQAPAFGTESQPQRSEPGPAVAAPEQPSSGGPGGEQPSLAQQAAAAPTTPWYVWTLIPIGLAGMYLMSRALTTAPAVATERTGAMSRLIEQRRQQAAAGGPQLQV